MEGVLLWLGFIYALCAVLTAIEWVVDKVYPETKKERLYRERMDKLREQGRLI